MTKISVFLSAITCLLSLLFMAPVSAATSEAGLTMGEAINKAGRQRMLSQRITKAYALVGQKIMMSANTQLYDGVELFEKQRLELSQFAATNDEKESITKVSKLWDKYRTLAGTSPTRESAVKMSDLSEKVLAEAHHFVLLLEKRSGTSAGHLVNISGRQRMLSQRIAKFYVLQSWELDNPEYTTEFEKAVRQFVSALHELNVAPENTDEINEALTRVELDWKTFNISKTLGGNIRIPSLVVRQMDKILGQMNHITGLYAAVHK